MFRRTYRLEAEFQNVAGLNNGADVRVGGIHLGTVKYISLPSGPSGKLTVVMDMANSTKNIIRQDSVATIKTEGLLGDKYVEISFGSEKAPEIESGDTIKGETPVDFSDAALAAMNQTKTAADRVRGRCGCPEAEFSVTRLLQTARLRGSNRTQKEQDFSTAIATQQQGICVRRQGHLRQIRQCETQE